MVSLSQWLSLFFIGVAEGMMDYRNFADPEAMVPLPVFNEPAHAPPSFIYARNQLAPPYNIDVDTLDPFPGCDAQYDTVCAVQHSIRLVTRVRVAACPEFAAGGSVRQIALDHVTAGGFVEDGTTGFGVFVILPNATIIADALRPDLVGKRFDGVLSSGLVAQAILLGDIDYVTRHKGGFVPHFSARLAKLDVLKGVAPQRASAYFEAWRSAEHPSLRSPTALLIRTGSVLSKTSDTWAADIWLMR